MAYLDSHGLETFWAKIKTLVSGKQDKLTAGTNITIDANNVISATGGGTSNHASLTNLEYANSGHTGFQQEITSSNKLSYSLLSDTPTIPTVPTNVSAFTNDSGYVTSSYHDSTKQDTISDLATIRSNASSGASKVSCTDATVGGFGYTKNTGTITGITMNGASKGTSGEVDLGTVVTDISGKQDKIDSAHKLDYSLISNTPTIPTVPTALSAFTDDLGSSPTHTHSQYLTSHQSLSAYRTSSAQDTIDAGKTSTSVLPNNSGNIKTKFRISYKGATKGATWYFPLVKLPIDNAGNYASCIISGRVGGWEANNMSSITALAWNRGSTGIALLDIAATATTMGPIFNTCNIVIYTNDDASDTVYLKVYGYFCFDIDIELYQSSASILYNETYLTSTPSGTLSASAQTSNKRVEIINGSLLVNGSTVPNSTDLANKENKGKMTISGTENTVVTHTLTITDGSTTTSYTLLGV